MKHAHKCSLILDELTDSDRGDEVTTSHPNMPRLVLEYRVDPVDDLGDPNVVYVQRTPPPPNSQ